MMYECIVSDGLVLRGKWQAVARMNSLITELNRLRSMQHSEKSTALIRLPQSSIHHISVDVQPHASVATFRIEGEAAMQEIERMYNVLRSAPRYPIQRGPSFSHVISDDLVDELPVDNSPAMRYTDSVRQLVADVKAAMQRRENAQGLE